MINHKCYRNKEILANYMSILYSLGGLVGGILRLTKKNEHPKSKGTLLGKGMKNPEFLYPLILSFFEK